MTVDKSVEDDRVKLRLSHWTRVAGLLWRLSPARVVCFVATAVVISVMPAIQLKLTAAAVQTVADAIADGGSADRTRSVVTIGALVMALSVVGHLFGAWYQYLDAVLRLQLATAIGEQLMH